MVAKGKRKGVSSSPLSTNARKGRRTEASQNDPSPSTGVVLPIQTDVPVRPAGQKHALGLTATPLESVRIGFIGLGMRGRAAIERFAKIPGAVVMALCDVHSEGRIDQCQEILAKSSLPAAAAYCGSEAWRDLCGRGDIDLVYICTAWDTHAAMARAAMENGKHVAVEVPGGTTLEDLWSLIDTSERTRRHCMMLENCIYDDFELTTLNMIHQGILGDVLYAEGGYIHQLEAFWGRYASGWRMKANHAQRGDLYPTHGMGPACQALDIHRGDKMDVLVSMDSTPVSIPAFLSQSQGGDVDPTKAAEDVHGVATSAPFQNGQHTMTMIRTTRGRTIFIEHDVASPRPYSRRYAVAGTKGYANKYPKPGYALIAGADGGAQTGSAADGAKSGAHSYISDDAKDALMKQYASPILTAEMEETAKSLGSVAHGGMDYVMDYRLVYCLRKGLPLDMDVYDMAEWSCLVPLSALSLTHGGAPVAVPDFTRGHWNDVKGFRHVL